MKEKVSKEEAQAEVNKYADKVSQADVASTVENESKFNMLFKCVDKLAEYKDEVALVFSMLKDFTTGKYKKCPWRTIAVLVGALAYVLAPLDLIPDFIPVIGWSDDCLALGGALAFAKMDLEEYKAWKASTPSIMEMCKRLARVGE